MKRYTAEVTVYSDVLMTRITSITQSVFFLSLFNINIYSDFVISIVQLSAKYVKVICVIHVTREHW